MFESIANFFKKLVKTEAKQAPSKETAKERLHLVLMQDRANVSADFLELMKQEIIEVIKKYIEVEESAIDVRLTKEVKEDGSQGAPSLYANIPILNIKNDMKKEQNEAVKEDKKSDNDKEKKTEIKEEIKEDKNKEKSENDIETKKEEQTEDIKEETEKTDNENKNEEDYDEKEKETEKKESAEVEGNSIKEEKTEENKTEADNSEKENNN